ncbi:MAG: ATP-binding protein [Flammeovirgaceae bacterium]
MQAILFIGIQATGKSTFYKEQFFHSHVRINLDLLKTRNREKVWLESCFKTQQRFVVDNTNPSQADRARYITPAKAANYEVIGYYFESKIKDALQRNSQRTGKALIPERGVLSCFSKLEQPSYAEGFDQLYFVKMVGNQFEVTEFIEL